VVGGEFVAVALGVAAVAVLTGSGGGIVAVEGDVTDVVSAGGLVVAVFDLLSREPNAVIASTTMPIVATPATTAISHPDEDFFFRRNSVGPPTATPAGSDPGSYGAYGAGAGRAPIAISPGV
jgi:hypothetical protein